MPVSLDALVHALNHVLVPDLVHVAGERASIAAARPERETKLITYHIALVGKANVFHVQRCKRPDLFMKLRSATCKFISFSFTQFVEHEKRPDTLI